MGKYRVESINGAFVSPYLRRPLRTYEEFLRDLAELALNARRCDSERVFTHSIGAQTGFQNVERR